MANAKNESRAGEYILRAAPDHPARKFRIQGHEIGQWFKKYELNEAEAAELFAKDKQGKPTGAGRWVEIGDEAKLRADSAISKKIKKTLGRNNI